MIWMSFGSMPGTSNLSVKSSLVSERSTVGVHRPSGASGESGSQNRSNSRSISFLRLMSPVGGSSVLMASPSLRVRLSAARHALSAGGQGPAVDHRTHQHDGIVRAKENGEGRPAEVADSARGRPNTGRNHA